MSGQEQVFRGWSTEERKRERTLERGRGEIIRTREERERKGRAEEGVWVERRRHYERAKESFLIMVTMCW